MKKVEGNIWQYFIKKLYICIVEINCCVFFIVKKMCKDKEILFEKQQVNDIEMYNYDVRKNKV